MKAINISMKAHLSVFVLVALSLTFHSCEQFELEEDPSKVKLAVIPYTNISELELAVTGTYGKYWNVSRQTSGFANTYAGDDITTHKVSNKADFREFDGRSVTLANVRLTENYTRVYSAVRAANTVLVNVEGIDLGDKLTQDRLVGEVYFLRAILFHHAARWYGRIPLPLGIVPNPEIGLASQLEVYQQIESDLLMAESLLPATSTSGTTKPSAGSARAILARLYLDWAGWPLKDNSKYSDAASSAKKVIDNASSHGFALVQDMGSLYTLAGNINSEGVFTNSFCAPCGKANFKTGKLGLPGDFGGWQETFAEIRFFEDMPAGARKDATYHAEIPLDANGKITSDVANAASFKAWTEFTDQQNPVFRKVVGPFEDNIFNGFQSSRSDYVIRYAEVLLIYAEAAGRSGSVTTDAWEALNKVRRRAYGLPVNSSDASDFDATDGAIEELAYTEKKWELAGEFLRWYDLMRMERVEEALGGTARDPQVSIGTVYDSNGVGTPRALTQPSNPVVGSLGTDNYFTPIPASEIEQNPNLAQ